VQEQVQNDPIIEIERERQSVDKERQVLTSVENERLGIEKEILLIEKARLECEQQRLAIELTRGTYPFLVQQQYIVPQNQSTAAVHSPTEFTNQ
jgi:hypothetical protein